MSEARKYINVSKIRLTAVGSVDEDGDILVSVRDVKRAIEQTPAADVVPRTEVENIFVELASKLNQMLPFKASSHINGEPLGNSFDFGKERTIYEILNFLNELEKKYTEGRNESCFNIN